MQWFNKKRNNQSHHEWDTEKLNDSMGIIISDLLDITMITPEETRKIRRYVDQFHLVVIKGTRVWTEQEQVSFTEKIGVLESPLIYSSPQSQLSQEKRENLSVQGLGLFWHSDRAYYENPSHLSVFQMTEIPLNGTKTSFVSLIESYKELPEAIRKKWKHYQAVYNNDVIHPLFWKHPFNGKNAIYLDLGFISSIRDSCKNGEYLAVKNGNSVMNMLNETFSKQYSLYKHIWEKGDIIIVDNYAVAHKADISIGDTPRMLQRSTTKGIYF